MYFMYCDESEMCKRAINGGFKIAVVPRSEVFHDHNFLKKGAVSEKIKYLKVRNFIIFTLKNQSRSFLYNLKYTFVWNRLKNFSLGLKPKTFTWIKIVSFITVMMPVIFCKHYFEQRKACYIR